MAGYLEGYAAQYDLPVINGVRVERLWREGDHYVAAANGRRWEAHNAVVATGCSQAPKVPAFAAELAPSIVQFHSSEYRNPRQLQDGPVLVVGLGNSGAEIGLEVSRTHPTIVAGKPGGELPVKHGPTAARYFLPVVRFLGLHVLTLGTPDRPQGGAGLQGTRRAADPDQVQGPGRRRREVVPRVAGVEDGMPVLADGTRLEVSNVIWCTGFRDDFSWIDPALLDDGALPRQQRGVALDRPDCSSWGRSSCTRRRPPPFRCRRDARYLAGKIPAPATRGPAASST